MRPRAFSKKINNSVSKLGLDSPSSTGRRRAAKDIAFLKNNPRAITTKDYISNKKTMASKGRSRNAEVKVSMTQDRNGSPFRLTALGQEMHMT